MGVVVGTEPQGRLVVQLVDQMADALLPALADSSHVAQGAMRLAGLVHLPDEGMELVGLSPQSRRCVLAPLGAEPAWIKARGKRPHTRVNRHQRALLFLLSPVDVHSRWLSDDLAIVLWSKRQLCR